MLFLVKKESIMIHIYMNELSCSLVKQSIRLCDLRTSVWLICSLMQNAVCTKSLIHVKEEIPT